MTHYDRLKRKKLGDILVDEGVTSRDCVITALHEQQRSGRLLSEILIDSREIDEYVLAKTLVEQYQAPYIDLQGYTLHKDLIERFPTTLLHASRVLPLEEFGDQICFACQEIPNEEYASQLREQSPGGLFFYIGSSIEIRLALNEYAPVTEADLLAETPAAEEQGAGEGVAEEGAWHDLFDSANEAILSDIGDVPPSDEG